MAFWTSLAVAAGACAFLFHREKARQVHLVRSTVVRAGANSVFDVVGNVERIPDWYRHSKWVPKNLVPTRLSRWGEHIPRDWRIDTDANSNEINIRWIQNREFAYSCRSRQGMSYDCIFRIAPKDKESTLVWEFRYRPRRWIDALCSRLTAQEISEGMRISLDTIRRLVESSTLQPKRRVELAPVWPEPTVMAS